jgi:hypothetical protein
MLLSFCVFVSPKLLKGMGWNFTHLFESKVGGCCQRSITVTWILIELWPFLNLENSTLSNLLFYHQALRIDKQASY